MVEHKKTDNPEFDAAVEEVNKFKDGGVQVSQKNQLRLYGAFPPLCEHQDEQRVCSLELCVCVRLGCYKVGCGQTVEKPGMFGGFDVSLS